MYGPKSSFLLATFQLLFLISCSSPGSTQQLSGAESTNLSESQKTADLAKAFEPAPMGNAYDRGSRLKWLDEQSTILKDGAENVAPKNYHALPDAQLDELPAHSDFDNDSGQEKASVSLPNKTLKGSIEKRVKGGTRKLDTISPKAGAGDEVNLDSSISQNAEVEETSINWNAWRNKVSKAIWAKFCQQLSGGGSVLLGNTVIKLNSNPPMHFPLNTKASYFCRVDDSGRLSDVQITESSGIKKFDEIVKNSVLSVEGKKYLKFPEGTKRKLVTLSMQLFTTSHGGFKEISFGDVERY